MAFKITAYVDGSFNQAEKKCGAGVVLIMGEDEEVVKEFSTYTDDPAFVSMRNVGGEILAATAVLATCKQAYQQDPSDELDVHIYYDYAGIEYWVTAKWRTNNAVTQIYAQMAQALPFPIHFHKVKAHSNDHYNERADHLAKVGCGLA